MEYNSEKREIKLDRELSNLDKFVRDFIKILEKHEEYVIVSGYVSIVLGRTRATEDVDLLLPKMSLEKFKVIYFDLIGNEFECANTSDVLEAYDMLDEHAIRFFKKGRPIPNIEFKIIKSDIDRYSLDNKIKLILDKEIFYISPLEMHIAFKLFLAAEGTEEEIKSDKDVEDARHIYKLFEERINKEEMLQLISQLGVKHKLKWIK